MSLKQRLTDDMKAAMRAGEKPRLGVIRLVLAAIKQREVDERIELTDAQILDVLAHMLKQRRDSFSQFENAGRDDLAAQERFEIEVIQTYMPTPLTGAELDAMIAEAITETGASSVRDMGKVMGLVKTRSAGRADMATASQRIKAKLA